MADQNETLKIETSDNLLKRRFVVGMGLLLLAILALLVWLGSMTNCACLDLKDYEKSKEAQKIEEQMTLACKSGIGYCDA